MCQCVTECYARCVFCVTKLNLVHHFVIIIRNHPPSEIAISVFVCVFVEFICGWSHRNCFLFPIYHVYSTICCVCVPCAESFCRWTRDLRPMSDKWQYLVAFSFGEQHNRNAQSNDAGFCDDSTRPIHILTSSYRLVHMNTSLLPEKPQCAAHYAQWNTTM